MTSHRALTHRSSGKDPSFSTRRAAVDELRLVSAWIAAPVTRALEWLFRFGARPSAATILHIDGGNEQFPRLGSLDRGGPNHSTLLGSPFPESAAETDKRVAAAATPGRD